ncbi:MAG: ATP synthase F0 subunit C [Phycisphaerae bacterium]
MLKAGRWLVILMVVGLLVSPAMAQSEGEQEAPADNVQGYPEAIAVVGACLGAAVAALGGGLAVASIGGKCIESMARQPEAASAMFAPMIITAAMVEGGMLFAILVCLLKS